MRCSSNKKGIGGRKTGGIEATAPVIGIGVSIELLASTMSGQWSLKSDTSELVQSGRQLILSYRDRYLT